MVSNGKTTSTTRKTPSTIFRVARFSLVRAGSLFLVVLISVYLTILVVNKSAVIEGDLLPPGANPSPISSWFSGISNMPVYYRSPVFSETFEDRTFFQRSIRLLVHGLTLNLGGASSGIGWGFPSLTYIAGSRTFTTVREAILDSLPRTLLVFGTANLLVFFTSLFIGVSLTRHYGKWLDRLILSIAPLSSLPPWIYGIFITVILAKVFQIFMGGMLNQWPDEFSWAYLGLMLKHMGPAILAIFLSKFFLSIFAWRSFLVLFYEEDYIHLAKAKGLPNKLIERRYLMRPVLPSIITAFSMMMFTLWQEAIVIELFFSIHGIGHVFYNAIRNQDMTMIVGLTVVFAYLLAITVFILDVAHALIDPRVKFDGETRVGKVVSKRRWNPFRRARQGRAPAVFPARAPAAAAYSTARSKKKEPPSVRVRQAFRSLGETGASLLSSTRQVFKEILQFRSATLGLTIILGLFAVSIYTLIALPYPEAVRRWNYEQAVWIDNPQKAYPEWINYFRRDPQPKNIFLDSRSDQVEAGVTVLTPEMTEISRVFTIDYPYLGFPQRVTLNVVPKYLEKAPHTTLTWITPDGREINLGDYSPRGTENIDLESSSRLVRQLGGVSPRVGLFMDPEDESLALPGEYILRMDTLVFEDDSDLDMIMKLYGYVFGWAGTDHHRRDLSVALMWGAPVALAIGFLGAVGTSVLSMTIAAMGTWWGGFWDGLVQRLTEINLILPVLPILLFIYNFYWKNFWVLIGLVVLLSIFSSSIKTYRTVFLQVKEAPYIEAALAYGTSSSRMILRYLMPRIISVLIPQIIVLVPSYVFLEATLAFLNISDPVLPTWGKVIQEAINNGGLEGSYHWLLMPLGVLLLTGFAFTMVGYSLERVLNPKLREV